MPADNRAVSDLQIGPGTISTRVFSRGALLHSLPSAVAAPSGGALVRVFAAPSR